MENQVGFGYMMPNGKTLYIFSNRPLTEEEKSVPIDEEIEGVHYFIKWGNNQFFFIFSSVHIAMGVAMGIQWGSNNA